MTDVTTAEPQERKTVVQRREVKTALAVYLDNQAKWRWWNAPDYPEDVCNERSALGLEDAATYVRTLVDDEPIFERLAALLHFEFVEDFPVAYVGEEAQRVAISFHFNVSTESVDEFLFRLVEAMEIDKANDETLVVT
jgi:hypothetical protein